MSVSGNVVGILAVIIFNLSYLMRARKNIIFFNALSRLLYVLQYILIGAFEGAVLDISAFVVSILCSNRHKGFVKNHLGLTILLSDIFLIGAGLLFYKNVFTLIAIMGVLFETTALWINHERTIRIVSLFGAPCWLAYNAINGAVGSSIGNVITIITILIAIINYDILKKTKKVE